ncbi:DUF2459 domain-containing protein [Nisaea sediminum]|uniref:DUF2459 domain-containing protein n=1 Tax=Nisaea sediminum TaxID=2775867 RepID=UPI00186801D4|nr:DUF2459 domain-containing protein [Nisaea sediminum]
MGRSTGWRQGLAATVLLLIFALRPAGAAEREIAVVNIGWHTGIALRVADIDPALIPEARYFANFSWVEFGWGDAEFYRTPDPDISVYLSAAFGGNGAVMHLVGMHPEPAVYFRSSEVMPVVLDEAEHRRLQAYLHRSFSRDDDTPADPMGHGLYPASLFFPATGSFSLANTCNSWVARGLAEAGLEIEPDGIIRADGVMDALRAALARR